VGIYQHGESAQIAAWSSSDSGTGFIDTTKPAEDQPEIDSRWSGIGIRIEDDVLVTTTGHEVLTAGVPKSVAQIEH